MCGGWCFPWSCSPSLCYACPGCAHASNHAVELCPHWQTAPGKYNEAALRGLDYLIDEARQAGIRVSLLEPPAALEVESAKFCKEQPAPAGYCGRGDPCLLP